MQVREGITEEMTGSQSVIEEPCNYQREKYYSYSEEQMQRKAEPVLKSGNRETDSRSCHRGKGFGGHPQVCRQHQKCGITIECKTK